MIPILTIVDYQAGGTACVKRALDYLGIPATISADPHEVEQSDSIILPGIGNAAPAMAQMTHSGMDQALRSVYNGGIPILSMCLGAEITATWSEEGDTPCLDLISGETLKIHPPAGYKAYHIGWDTLRMHREHPVFSGLEGEAFYFVHDYYTSVDDPDSILASFDHGFEIPAAIMSNNLIAIQFKPEKSGPAGLKLLQNFCDWGGW